MVSEWRTGRLGKVYKANIYHVEAENTDSFCQSLLVMTAGAHGVDNTGVVYLAPSLVLGAEIFLPRFPSSILDLIFFLALIFYILRDL